MRIRTILPLLACLILATTSAGVVIETEVSVDGRGITTDTAYFAGDKFRSDTTSARDGDMSVIFADDTLWFLDHAKKRAQKIDRKTIAELAGMMQEMMKQLEQMPPKQREMMEKMMSGRMPGMKEQPTYRSEPGESTTVGEIACKLHTLYADDQKQQESCLADESSLPELREALSAVQAMAAFADELRNVASNLPFGDMLRNIQMSVPETDGFPVQTRFFNNDGKVTRESTVTSVEARDVDASMLQLPKGYTVKDMGKELKKQR